MKTIKWLLNEYITHQKHFEDASHSLSYPFLIDFGCLLERSEGIY